jgi:hypothetical protein
MPGMHLYIVHKKFEGYRNSLDEKRQKFFRPVLFNKICHGHRIFIFLMHFLIQ